MTIDPELLELLSTAVQLRPYTGLDSFGNNTYGATEVVMARVENFTRSTQVTDSREGTTVARIGASCELIVDWEDPGYNVKDEVTVRGIPMEVTEVTTVDDENGPYYQSLKCSNNQEG